MCVCVSVYANRHFYPFIDPSNKHKCHLHHIYIARSLRTLLTKSIEQSNIQPKNQRKNAYLGVFCARKCHEVEQKTTTTTREKKNRHQNYTFAMKSLQMVTFPLTNDKLDI